MVVAVVVDRAVSARLPQAEPSRPSEERPPGRAEDSARSPARPKRLVAAAVSARRPAEALEAAGAVATARGQISPEAVSARCVAKTPRDGGEGWGPKEITVASGVILFVGR